MKSQIITEGKEQWEIKIDNLSAKYSDTTLSLFLNKHKILFLIDFSLIIFIKNQVIIKVTA